MVEKVENTELNLEELGNRYWIRYRRPRKTGGFQVTSGSVLDKENFIADFGENTVDTLKDYLHYRSSKEPKAPAFMQEAADRLLKAGVNPNVLVQGKQYARIEDV